MAIVLRIDPAVVVQRGRSISGANGELLEDVLNQDTSLPDGVEIAILAVGIDSAICVHHGRIDAPFKAVRMVGNAGQTAVSIAGAALGVGVLEAPLNVEVGVELRNEILFRSQE